MLNRIGFFILGLMCIIVGNVIFATKKYSRNLIEHDFSNLGNFYIIPATSIILFGVVVFYLALRPKSHINKYSNLEKLVKCKKCRKTFQYKDTNEGKCPTCNIDTIDIEEFYEVAKKRKDEKFFKKSKKK